MNLDRLFALVANRGLGFSIDPKLRPGDQQYVTVYSAGNHSHARKSFNSFEEMAEALEQCVGEVQPQSPPGPCTLGGGCNEAGVCYADKHGEGVMCGAEPAQVTLPAITLRGSEYTSANVLGDIHTLAQSANHDLDDFSEPDGSEFG